MTGIKGGTTGGGSGNKQMKPKHNWFGKRHSDRLSVFASSDFKDDGTLHPIRVNLKGSYKDKQGNEHISYVDISPYDLDGVIEDLVTARDLNAQHFGTFEKKGSNVKMPAEGLLKRR
ncbi:MAG: hypothetical protein FWD81_02795 [Methanomassiliicoccaceae archaeon]|nr:hypothetical protein [Methanomassiliicoccaceae archaeon]